MPYTVDTIKTSITIHVKPRLIYTVVTDFKCYSRWNPWIIKAEGECVVGNEIRTRHALFGTITHRLAEITPPERLCWEIASWHRYLVQARREVLVFPGLENNSLVTVKVTLTGPLLIICRLLFKKSIRRRMKAEIIALKQFCEALPQPPSKSASSS